MTRSALKVAHCTNIDCSTNTSYTVDLDGDIGKQTSMVIGSDGYGLIGYFDDTSDDLKMAHCSNIPCASWTITSVITSGGAGDWNSMTVGTDGNAVISYYDSFNGWLEVAHCVNITCTAATSVDVDTAGGLVGQHTSITIGADGLPLIVYHDVTSRNLKAAHCSNPRCTPNVRAR